MSDVHVPVKTPLGQQELRQRSKALGQRHRTVLLLVDGRRPLAEVLSMAHQAGAMTAHFEELVRLGMVELPVPPPAEPPEPAPEPSTELLVEHRVEALVQEPVVQAVEPAAGPAPETRGQEDASPPAGPQEAAAAAAAAAPAVEPPSPEPPPVSVPVPVPVPAPAIETGRKARRKPDAASASKRSDLPPAGALKLDEVRSLLIDILRRDTLLHRLFAPARVRSAKSHEALIALVWEIERERAHVHRKRIQLIALQRARELLGMGNTLVAEDTLPFLPTQP